MDGGKGVMKREGGEGREEKMVGEVERGPRAWEEVLNDSLFGLNFSWNLPSHK